ncbi:MAG TPA: hypothetical protein VMK13_01225, partial [Streptosporangiaceae bacterium]|nr:hypothetical protein [Streptosporangiaceae bacterium]
MATAAARTVGIEEELLLVDPASGEPRAVAAAVVRAARESARQSPERGGGSEPAEVLEFELQLEQLETGTRPCLSLPELR